MMQRKWNESSDFLAHLRKPHGILAAAILLGIVAWAVWTYAVAHNV
jgi:hypothetical protein